MEGSGGLLACEDESDDLELKNVHDGANYCYQVLLSAITTTKARSVSHIKSKSRN